MYSGFPVRPSALAQKGCRFQHSNICEVYQSSIFGSDFIWRLISFA